MRQKPYFIIDFDSTFITSEALEELAYISLHDHPDQQKIYAEICAITNLGMEGKISFTESLARRIRLIKANRRDVEKVTKLLKKKITPSIKRNKEFFQANKNNIYILSGAFKECIVPIIKLFGIPENHVFANTFVFDRNDNVIGIDTLNPLSGKNGKYIAAKLLGIKGRRYIIGDGFTDYQVKQLGAAECFIAFVENVKRESVMEKADYVAHNFDDFLREYQL